MRMGDVCIYSMYYFDEFVSCMSGIVGKSTVKCERDSVVTYSGAVGYYVGHWLSNRGA